MKEVRFHGRGGQGAVTAARILALALFREGKIVQAFPFFGMERRGSPVQAFLRFSMVETIAIRTYVYAPDYIVVLDPTLFKTVDILSGLKDNGLAIINTTEHPSKLGLKVKNIATVDATTISLKALKNRIVNIAMLGAFASATGEVSLKSVFEATKESFTERLAKPNIQAAKMAYQETKLHNLG